MAARRNPWWGLLVLGALALHAWSLGRANLAHLLWSCHVASLCLALGMVAGSRNAVAAGWLFHLAIGFPAWIVEMIVTRMTFGGATVEWHLVATSTLVHLAPILAGALWLGRDALPLPRVAVPIAWAIQVLLIPISRPLTPPDFNVNLSQSIWPSVAGMFSRLWVFQAVISLLCLASVLLVAMIIEALASGHRGIGSSVQVRR